MEKLLRVSEMRDLERQVANGEISYSRMVEIINQKHFMQLISVKEQKLTTKRELIKKHLEDWSGLQKSSIENFVQYGKISGSFLIAIEKMMDEYCSLKRA